MIVSEWLSHRSLRRHSVLGAVFATAMVAVALALRWIVGDLITGAYFLMIFPAVVASVALAGLRAGLLATVLGGAGVWYLLRPPTQIHGDVILLLLFLLIAAATCGLIESILRATAHQAALAERNAQLARNSEALKEEMEHRLRNQLQFISGMLRFEQKQIGDPAAAETLERAGRRIQTIAELHTRISRPDGTEADFPAYLEKLCGDLLIASGKDNVKIAVHARVVDISAPRVLPISLIVSELVTNSLKHGVAAVANGEIGVVLSNARSGELQLEVTDNGPGLDPSRLSADASAKPSAVGLRLVGMFAEQLGGTLEIVPGAGGHFRIVFPKDDPAEVAPDAPARGEPHVEGNGPGPGATRAA